MPRVSSGSIVETMGNGFTLRILLRCFEYVRNKYERQNYEEIAHKLKAEMLHRPDNIRQITLRLLANILLGNGHAYLKNWSLIYRDTRQADLSPA